MTKDNAKDYLPLVKALAEGKTIQVLMTNPPEWHDVVGKEVSFINEASAYRIKPEPRTWWIRLWNNHCPPQVFDREPEVEFDNCEIIKVQEVI